MSLLSENVIPGNQGRVFGTNAEKKEDLEKIKQKVLELDGIVDVVIDYEKFPAELVIYTDKLVQVKDIEQSVEILEFHLIPKGIFQL